MNTAQAHSGENLGKSGRIATNTLVLFVRMFLIIVINLYAVRVVLQNLGETDYGVFNTIAGVVLTSTFLSHTLALSVQRFYSYAIGKQEGAYLREIFSASLLIVILLSLLILILFESVGIWFVDTQLIIPADRLPAARWIFQFALFSFILTLLQIPFIAAVFAHEDMGFYALISTIDCILRLLVAWLIGLTAADHLILYGGGLLGIAFLVFLSYVFIACRRYTECRFKKVKQKEVYKELLSFSGWTMYGNISGMAMIQGSTILLNVFFGPLANAAFAIANQIYNALGSLSNTVVLAFRPAMIKSYAEQKFDYLDGLFYVHNKALLYLQIAVCLPLVCEMPTILHWWLGDFSQEMVVFSRLFVVYVVGLVMNNPISTIIQATGHVKYYSLTVESITILSLPVAWLFFRLGYPSFTLFVVMIVICILAHLVRLICLHHYYPSFSYRQYIFTLIVPATICVLLSLLAVIPLHRSISSDVLRFLSVVAVSTVVISLCAYFIGLNRDERSSVTRFVKHYIRR